MSEALATNRYYLNNIFHPYIFSLEAKQDDITNPEQRAVQKFKVFLTLPVITCVVMHPSEVTVPPRDSMTYLYEK